MKNFLIYIILFCVFVFKVNAQYTVGYNYKTSSYVDGYWSTWKPMNTGVLSLSGNFHSIAIFDINAQSNFFKFTINNFHKPSKKEIKEHFKKNLWYEYSGTVEYYRTDEFLTAKDQLSRFQMFLINHEAGHNNKPVVKQVSNAKIKIAPYKKTPRCYNIYFDNVGFAIDLENIIFRNW